MHQVLAITLMNLRSVPQRFATSLVVCVGIAGVVAVLVTVLAMATGLTDTLGAAGRADRAIVLRDGARAESLSSLSREATLAIETAPGLATDPIGKLISPEVVVSFMLPRSDRDISGAVPIRGLVAGSERVRPELTVIEGRLFQPGLHEVVVGRMVREQFLDTDIGSTVRFHNADWRVVGVFASGGDAHESEMITDAATLMAASHRTVYSATTVTLASANALAEFEAALEDDPRLKVDVERESDYYAERSEQVSRLMFVVAYVIGSIMALGALFGALNTMYTAVSARTVEIATLRAVGFGAGPVVVSVLIEALTLAVIGALTGVAIAWVLFNGNDFTTGGTLGQVSTTLDVGPALLATGVVWACVIGFLGGLFPAVRAARLPVATGLRVIV